MSAVAIVLLVAAVVWLVARDARAEWVAAEEARWDAWVEAALTEGNSHSGTPIYDELAVARFRRDMDRLDEVTEEWGR